VSKNLTVYWAYSTAPKIYRLLRMKYGSPPHFLLKPDPQISGKLITHPTQRSFLQQRELQE
ncbi:MAG: hypothetical protein R6U46_03670, partial [Marinilabilia sp.]